ncbi:DUF3106 domain-containing protein [Luteimonas sp. BDR2-5]|uniref:DUF3106 domain-containing protein n=1 Tax=Proluteimonas luteida TaxID=2878685 RepID=UPI001E32721F|nr:DUF3106 domain-containing protein [Luteimonas sp. BDR2-5]MCD9027335.1 DUF3106 domain-containing protein [Luteimonas sp. BDR2-5]
MRGGRSGTRLLLAAVLACSCAGALALPATIPGWEHLPAAERERLTARAARLAAMTPAQRQAFAARVAEWHALPAATRAQQREAWEALQALPHAERMRLQAAAERYAALPEAERKALRARFDSLDQGMQRGWLLGPTLGAAWPGLHPLFAAMPNAQHAPAMLALRAMSAQAVADLAVLAQRTPPQDRDALRTRWLAVPAAERDAWLRAQVDP